MKGIGEEGKKYMDALKGRAKQSKVFYSHQFAGLEIAVILRDMKHKSLYIKLAKEHNPDMLLSLAKQVMEKRDVKTPGAYFMKLVYQAPKVHKVKQDARLDEPET